ncbi:hypothetical protein [Nocardia terpenica]|uniref:hypothetical protein n=1 Tax=Nocardia terpenica TaxID=455432 RepID=UPI001E484797|nr:hypothetical protein [Nocardia terpenica]
MGVEARGRAIGAAAADAWVWDIDAGTCLCSPQIHGDAARKKPDPLTLEAAGWEAARAAEAGAFSAHVDLRTKTVVRWFGTVLPGAQCEMTGHEERDPAIHPEDIEN